MTTADADAQTDALPTAPGVMPRREEESLWDDLTPALKEFWLALRRGGEYPASELHAVCLAGCGAPATAGRYVRRLRRKLHPFGWTVECVLRGRRGAHYRAARLPAPPPWLTTEAAPADG